MDEARARTQLQAVYATYRAVAALGGARPSQLKDLTDPADEFTSSAAPDLEARAADPSARASQIAAFVAATGGEEG